MRSVNVLSIGRTVALARADIMSQVANQLVKKNDIRKAT